jgi:hypothetical protein
VTPAEIASDNDIDSTSDMHMVTNPEPRYPRRVLSSRLSTIGLGSGGGDGERKPTPRNRRAEVSISQKRNIGQSSKTSHTKGTQSATPHNQPSTPVVNIPTSHLNPIFLRMVNWIQENAEAVSIAFSVLVQSHSLQELLTSPAKQPGSLTIQGN